MLDDYKVLGLSEDATDEEVEQAYQRLKEKYSKDRFLEGEVGNQAASKLTKVENAYKEIKEERSTTNTKEDFVTDFSEVENLIRDGKINEAQALLDVSTDRNAEWHYLQSIIFYKKNWINESKKQLEIAVNIEPNNPKYSENLKKLNDKLNFNQKRFHSGNTFQNENVNEHQQMGGDACQSCLECIACNLCLNIACGSCCR